MNGTIIDIPGISVSVNPISLEDSSDKAYVINIKDSYGRIVTLEVIYGKITNISCEK